MPAALLIAMLIICETMEIYAVSRIKLMFVNCLSIYSLYFSLFQYRYYSVMTLIQNVFAQRGRRSVTNSY